MLTGVPVLSQAAVATATVIAQPVAAAPIAFAVPLEGRLHTFYSKHNPAKLQDQQGFSNICNEYRGNEAALNQALFAAYGAVLNHASGVQPQISQPQMMQPQVVHQIHYQQPPRFIQQNYCGPITTVIFVLGILCFIPVWFMRSLLPV
jgi:hypothetical protein